MRRTARPAGQCAWEGKTVIFRNVPGKTGTAQDRLFGKTPLCGGKLQGGVFRGVLFLKKADMLVCYWEKMTLTDCFTSHDMLLRPYDMK